MSDEQFFILIMTLLRCMPQPAGVGRSSLTLGDETYLLISAGRKEFARMKGSLEFQRERKP